MDSQIASRGEKRTNKGRRVPSHSRPAQASGPSGTKNRTPPAPGAGCLGAEGQNEGRSWRRTGPWVRLAVRVWQNRASGGRGASDSSMRVLGGGYSGARTFSCDADWPGDRRYVARIVSSAHRHAALWECAMFAPHHHLLGRHNGDERQPREWRRMKWGA